MKRLQRLLRDISDLTLDIETNYPELYRHLDENPITIPSKAHPEMDSKIMHDYLEDLKQLLKHHLDTHK